MNESDMKNFIETLESFSAGMLVTQRGNELRSRPMAIADCTDTGRVWFITSVDSGKLEELTEHPRVNVSMQSDSRFLSISGTARTTRDAAKIDELWRNDYSIWFDKGKQDPSLILLEIVPTFAEYWDRSGFAGMRFMFAAAKGAIAGETLDEDDIDGHGKIDFPSRPAARH
ncbi:MAG: pyridoxamine 5'-phosphate oxidase family protein [Woeseiaceae bacterium]